MTDQSDSIYDSRGDLYDLIYHWKDYEAEAATVRRLLLAEGVEDGSTLLELACGTGAYLVHLASHYQVSGLDIGGGMVEAARRKMPGSEIILADMVDFTLDRPVEAMVCLFSSIGYVFPEARLRQAAEAMFRNLAPGGGLLIEPWLQPHLGKPGHFSQQTYDGPEVKLCRAGVHEVEGRVSTFDFHWLVTTAAGCEHFVDHHQLYMYTREELLAAFAAAGFVVRWEEEGLMPGRGLLVGRKPEGES